jgi:DNA-binding MarR family transcriptional regulator
MTSTSDHIRGVMSISSFPKFTDKQGQYLAFIYLYTKLNRQAPAEADIQKYFQVTPPSVHNMILTLEKNGLIRRQPGRARTIEVLVPPTELPELR